MCNRYGYQHPFNALPDEFSDLGCRWDGLSPNAPLDQIRPKDRAWWGLWAAHHLGLATWAHA
jgi:hypothetical protein